MLLALAGVLGGTSFLLCCWRRYELAIGMLLLSPWVNWIFYSNTPVTSEEEGAVGAASYIRILLVFLIGCCGAVQFSRYVFSRQRQPFPKYLLFFGLFVLYAIASTGYSLDRKFTLIRSFEFMFFFLFLLGFHGWLENRRKLDVALNLYYWVIVVSLLLNAAALVLVPQRAWDWRMPDRLQGLTDHPNMFGALCMLAYPILAWKYTACRGAAKSTAAFLMVLTAGLHVLSGSRSSLLSAVLGGIVWMFLSVKTLTLKRIAACLIFTLLIVVGLSVLWLTKPASLKRGDSAITTLTGRTEFWQGCLVLIKEQPLCGYGYGVAGKVWEDPRFYREGEFLWAGSAKSSLHNGYLSLAIGLGLVGLLGWLIFISVPIGQVVFLLSSPYKAFILAMIMQLLVLNFFESALSSGSQIHTSLIFWSVLIIAGRLPQLLTSKSELMINPYRKTNIGFVCPTTNIPAGLCSGYAGTR